jgi:hypothetical protein
MHRSLPDIRRRGGPRNYFGSGADGDVVISANTSLTSTADGDMVVKNYKSLTINAGKILTLANRCRGALIYVQGDCIINGTLSMTARGAHARPTDTTVTANTPVAPSDGHAVPADGITIRRLAAGQTGTDEDADLMWGCGAAAVAAELNQPVVSGNGIVIRIPRVGGAGAAAVTSDNGLPGGTLANAPGGGGSGASSPRYAHVSSAGAAATCYSGGSGGGGVAGSVGAANAVGYGGRGGNGDSSGDPGFGGAGNPIGEGDTNGAVPVAGTGGLLILIVGGNLSGSGVISADGSNGGYTTLAAGSAGGAGSGGGVAVVLHGGTNSFTGTIRANGGVGGPAYDGGYSRSGGSGGAGSVVGPTKIDPA